MNRTFVLDLFERVAVTFLGGVLAVVGADGVDIVSLELWQAAAIAGGAAAISLVKGLLAQYTGPTNNAGLGT